MSEIVSLQGFREQISSRDDCLKQLGTIKFYVRPGGEVLTKDEHIERQMKKDAIEQAAKDRL